MAQSAELMLPCLDAAGVRTIVEVGAFAGDLTRVLVDWAAAGARVTAVDPSPQDGLVALARERPELELIRETSLAALPELPTLPDAVVIDGDHNYFTVSEELRIIGERAPGAELPLLLFHDVCWPHGRRDDYFDPELIPERYRQPVAGGAGGIVPDDPGLRPGGLPYPRSAAREGGPDNGVLTAIEDVRRRPPRRPARGRAGVLRARRRVAPGRALVRRACAHPRRLGSPPDPGAAGGQPRPPSRAGATCGGPSCGRSASAATRHEARAAPPARLERVRGRRAALAAARARRRRHRRSPWCPRKRSGGRWTTRTRGGAGGSAPAAAR